jgi:hypothetical protein
MTGPTAHVFRRRADRRVPEAICMTVRAPVFPPRLPAERLRDRGDEGAGRAAGLEDAVVVNTCAVTAEAVRKARQEIRRLRRDNPDAR